VFFENHYDRIYRYVLNLIRDPALSTKQLEGQTMFKKNLGRLDRTVRLIVGVALILIGLFVLGGWQGNSTGVYVALFALVPLATGLVGFCGLYVPFRISTLEKK
jgi:hypothetical protein